MKKSNPTIKAQILRSAFYLLLLLGVCAIPFALAQRSFEVVEIFRGPDHMAMRMGEAIRKGSRAMSDLTSENGLRSCWRDRANSSGLTLRENANQRTGRWRLRTKIANESGLGPDLHM